MNQSTLMMSPADLKAFQADDAIVKASIGSGMSYLDAEELFAKSSDTLQQRWIDAMECGSALARIRDTESYRDSHASWTAYCRTLRCEGASVSRTHVGRLVRCSEVLATLPPSLIGRIGMPLSFRLLDELGDIDEDDRNSIAEESLDDEDAACERLNETLKQMRENKAATPGDVKAPRGIEWVRKHTTALERWLHEELGDDELAMSLIRDLIQRAELILASRNSRQATAPEASV